MCASLPVNPSSQLVMEAPSTKIQIEGTWFLHFMQLFTSYICGWIVKIFARDIRMDRDEVTHRYVITRRFLVVTFSKRIWLFFHLWFTFQQVFSSFTHHQEKNSKVSSLKRFYQQPPFDIQRHAVIIVAFNWVPRSLRSVHQRQTQQRQQTHSSDVVLF